jgi:4-hydroxybenzoyl-CoA thioesterase
MGHCDPSGIVFFPQYFVMLNEVVEDALDALGAPLATLIGQRGTGLPTVRLECDFGAISRFGDRLVQRLAVSRIGSSSLTLSIEMRCADERRFAARQVLVCTSLATHRPQPLPADLREGFARWLEPR